MSVSVGYSNNYPLEPHHAKCGRQTSGGGINGAACEKCIITGFTPELLSQNLHFIKMPM